MIALEGLFRGGDASEVLQDQASKVLSAMRCCVWHQDQKAVCHCLAAILNLASDSDQDATP